MNQTNLISKRAQALRSSDIRELLRHAHRPGMISLAGGLPAPELFDVEGLRIASQQALEGNSVLALQYGLTEGNQTLREQVLALLAKRGVVTDPSTLSITSGSQQALDLVARAFIDEGDTVVVERPTYLAALQAFNLSSPRYLSLNVDQNGGDVYALEKLDLSSKPKFVYVVTNFANPSGACMSLERRQWLVQWAAKNEVLVIEDDPYGELRTSGQAIPSVYELAQSVPGARDWCGYTSTLSKFVAPGLRLGWLVLPERFTEVVQKLKQAMDLHTSSFTQEVAAAYLASGRLEAHMQVIRKEYGLRREVLQEALTENFGERFAFHAPAGGMFLWGRFTQTLDTRALLAYALDCGVSFVPGDIFYTEHPDHASLRLNFTACTPAQLREGVRRLKLALNRLH
jgi:2-aminoadipate transaminase